MASSPTPKIEPPTGAVELEDTAPIVSSEPAPVELVEPVYPSWRVLARWLLIALALYGVGWLLWNAQPALVPFIIGLVLAYLLTPIVNLLDRRMPRWLAILLVYVGGIILLVTSINYIVPPVLNQTQQLIESIPPLERLQQIGNELLRQYRASVPPSIQTPIEEGVRNALETAQANLALYLEEVGTFIFSQILQVLNTVTFLVGFLIIPIWLFYLLNDQAKGRALLDRLLHPRIRPDFWNIWGMINRVFSDYIRGQLILGVIVGVMVGLGLLILRLLGFEIRYILLLSIVAGLTELIPIVGPIIGAIPGVVLGFIVPETGALQTGLAVLAVYIIVQQLENNFLVPRIIGESVGIHPAILTVVLIAMGHIFGLLGVILAAPLSAIARDLFIYIYRRLEGFSATAAQGLVNKQAEVDTKAAQS